MQGWADHAARLFDGVQVHGFPLSGISSGLEPSEHRRASRGSVIFSADTVAYKYFVVTPFCIHISRESFAQREKGETVFALPRLMKSKRLPSPHLHILAIAEREGVGAPGTFLANDD